MKYENTILHGPAEDKLKTIDSDSIDCLITDPPYGYSFMNKDWDKAVVPVDTWKQCLRVLKPGAFAFIMSSPRQDVLCKMILNLIDAGFETNFTSLYWTYASGFPKAADVSKLVDKKGGLNLSSFRQIIKKRRIEMGLSTNQLAVYFPSKTGGITGCVRNWEGLGSLPTIEEYNKLLEILKLDKEQYPELEEIEREITGKGKSHVSGEGKDNTWNSGYKLDYDYTKPATPQAKRLEGSYAGFQPKPAVELILVVMKPLSEKTFVDQALSNQKGITWLDDCRIPYENEQDKNETKNAGSFVGKPFITESVYNNGVPQSYSRSEISDKGRFPANLLVEDDVLNDGKIRKGTGGKWNYKFGYRHYCQNAGYDHITEKAANQAGPIHRANDEGTFSRYFSLDSWTEKTLPFLIVPKAAKAEKNKGCEALEEKPLAHSTNMRCEICGLLILDGQSTNTCKCEVKKEIRQTAKNFHPTVKPLKLMSYLITMGSRQGDIVLDPFCGSGTVLIAARQLARDFIGVEVNQEYVQIANTRLKPYLLQTRLL